MPKKKRGPYVPTAQCLILYVDEENLELGNGQAEIDDDAASPCATSQTDDKKFEPRKIKLEIEDDAVLVSTARNPNNDERVESCKVKAEIEEAQDSPITSATSQSDGSNSKLKEVKVEIGDDSAPSSASTRNLDVEERVEFCKVKTEIEEAEATILSGENNSEHNEVKAEITDDLAFSSASTRHTSSRSESPVYPPVTKAFAILPQKLVSARPALLNLLQENCIQILTPENVSLLSDDVGKLRLVETHVQSNAEAPMNPLYVACPHQCRTLIKRIFPNTMIKRHIINRNCGVSAIDNVSLKVFEALFRYTIDIPCAFGYFFNGSLLHFAISCPSRWKDLTEMLLDNGADVNSLDPKIRTPLYRAVEGRNLEAVKVLLKYGACVNTDCGGTTVLSKAYYYCGESSGRSTMFEYLLERCFVDPKSINESELQKILHEVHQERFAEGVRVNLSDSQAKSVWRSETLGRHLVKILALHQLDNFSCLDGQSASVIKKLVRADFRKDCEAEVLRMNVPKFGSTNLSVYKFLLASEEIVAGLLENNSATLSLKELKKLKKSFPFYSDILECHLEKGRDRLWMKKRPNCQRSGNKARELPERTSVQPNLGQNPRPQIEEPPQGPSIKDESNNAGAPKRPASQNGNLDADASKRPKLED